MAAGKEIKSRIKTVKNTGKITKAMELISTVKMKKAQENVLQLRSFAMAALSILKTISSDENIFKKYTIAPNTQKELIVVIASQKGLCGGYNVNTFKKVMEYLRREGGGYARDNDFVVIGKRARDFILRMNQKMIADYSDEIKDPATISEARSVVRFLLDAWNSGKYSKISIVYNHYVSAISQLPVVKPIFPFQEKEITDFLNRISGDETQKDSHENIDFIIEPNHLQQGTTISYYNRDHRNCLWSGIYERIIVVKALKILLVRGFYFFVITFDILKFYEIIILA